MIHKTSIWESNKNIYRNMDSEIFIKFYTKLWNLNCLSDGTSITPFRVQSKPSR